MRRYKRKNSLRLKGYDYSQAGAYFVTILTYKRQHYFGEIIDSKMSLSPFGEVASRCWYEIPAHMPSVELDAFVIMPNHMHGILILHDDSPKNPSLGHVINTYKGAVTRLTRQAPHHFTDENPLWHRNFHDHIIRSNTSYRYIANYVQTNPARWEDDSLNS